jgi:hypothetical protein
MESIITDYIDLLKHAFLDKEAAYRGPDEDEQKIRQETEKIKSILPREFYSIENEAGQQAFIRNQYAGLFWLSDRFCEIAQTNKEGQQENSGELLPVQQFVLSTLDHLLTFLREHFRSCCSDDQKIPEYSRPAVTSEMLDKLEALNLPVTHYERRLFEKVKAAVRRRFREPGITYRLVAYLQALIDGISQFPASPAGAFKIENESVVDFLGKWIRAEILFYEESPSVPGHSGPASFSGHACDNLKLEINLSVPQIAYLKQAL